MDVTKFCNEFSEWFLYVTNESITVPLIGPPPEPNETGLNSELVLIVRPNYGKISCFGPQLCGHNSGLVLILSFPNRETFLYIYIHDLEAYFMFSFNY